MLNIKKSRTRVYIIITIFFLLIIGFVSVNISKTPCIPVVPDRIGDIPNDARWIGGCDGGFWYNIVEVYPKENKYLIGIYFAYNGELIVEKEFYLENNCLFIEREKLYESIINYDFFIIETELNECNLIPMDNSIE